MAPINIMINGLPGNVASVVAGFAVKDERVRLVPFSLTGPEINEESCTIGKTDIRLIRPDERDRIFSGIRTDFGDLIGVDFTHPSAVNDNAAFYCNTGLPFVMGTTGGNRDSLVETVQASDTVAVIAPNMAKQIVGFQAIMAYAADNFPDLFKEYRLTINESHQAGKADTSGTAKAMVGYFNKLGIPFAENEIIKERDPVAQKGKWGIPEAYLPGHAWHTYRLTSADDTVAFEFKHNVNGRDIYAAGTLDAVVYLDGKIRSGARGRVFSMIDVLRKA